MTKKYFVVSESELRRLGDAAYQLGYEEARTRGAPNESFPAADKKAEAACRAREVVFYDNLYTPYAEDRDATVVGVLWLEEKK